MFVDTPIEECASQATPKDLCRKATAVELKGFTGIDDPYEPHGEPTSCWQARVSAADRHAPVVAQLNAKMIA